jgi:hypothetical protein
MSTEDVVDEKDKRDFRRAVKRVDALLERLDKKYPELGLRIYLSPDRVNLMAGPAHDDNERPRYEAVVEDIMVDGWDGGDW